MATAPRQNAGDEYAKSDNGNVDTRRGGGLYQRLESIELQDSLEDMPPGKYAFVIYESSLADDGNTTEMVGVTLENDSTWRVIGYQTD